MIHTNEMISDRLKKMHKNIIGLYDEGRLKSAGVPDGEIQVMRNYIIVPIGLLVKGGWNYKTSDESKEKKLKANLDRIGQVENIHVRLLQNGLFEIVNGEHRYDEMMSLGKSFVLVYNHGSIDLEEAVRRSIETNETKFETDPFELAKRMSELSKTYDIQDLELTMPYSEQEIENMVKMIEYDLEKGSDERNTASDTDTTRKTISFDIEKKTYDKWIEVRKHIEAGNVVSRERAFEFMVFVTGSLTVTQIKSFHKKIEDNG